MSTKMPIYRHTGRKKSQPVSESAGVHAAGLSCVKSIQDTSKAYTETMCPRLPERTLVCAILLIIISAPFDSQKCPEKIHSMVT